jgi:hypothetical protein
MPDLITLTCPTCGAKLKVTDQIHLLACRNCGNEHMVIRNADTMYLAPIAQDVRRIAVSTDKTAAELAVARLTRAIESLDIDLAEINKRPLNDWKEPTIWERIFAIVPVIILLVSCSFFGSGNGAGLLYFFLFVGTVIIYFVINQKRTLDAKALKQDEHDRVAAIRNEKMAALVRNRKIIDD